MAIRESGGTSPTIKSKLSSYVLKKGGDSLTSALEIDKTEYTVDTGGQHNMLALKFLFEVSNIFWQ